MGRFVKAAKEYVLILKGNRDGVSIIINEHAHIEQTVNQLRAKLKDTGDFFRGAAFRLVTGDRELTPEELDAISGAVEEFGVRLRESTPDKLSESSNIPDRTGFEHVRHSHLQNSFMMHPSRQTAVVDAGEESDIFQSSSFSEPLGGTEFISDATLLLRRTVRSGQRIEYTGNVVVMGDVNAGAVITCTGDIVVLGSLRGVAHAGAEGNENAVVLAFRLEPTQLRIARYISRSPDETDSGPKGPEQARVQDGMILIEAYVP